MSFVSTAFAVFFVVFLLIYHLLYRSRKLQNILIVAANLFFYGWWDWRFAGLLLFTTGVDYLAARIIDEKPSLRLLALTASIVSNLVVLAFFKYFNFFIDSFADLLGVFGVKAHLATLYIILPIGISFYTFQSIAYTVDVYRGIIKAERNPIDYFAYVAFFPQLVAGPIERARHLLVQFRASRSITAAQVEESIWLLIWGYFLKIAVADNLAPFVELGFRTDQRHGWSAILGTIAFGIQIFGDFCGYSLIARATAGLLGFRLVWNFKQPYLAQSIQEFWRCWHVSLSEWLRDYLYIPLGGNRLGTPRTYANLIITMTLGGLWHGAAWHFLLWGLFHGVILALYHAYDRIIDRSRRLRPFLAWIITMTVVFFGWFLFRAESISMMAGMIQSLHNMSWTPIHTDTLSTLVALTIPVMIAEWSFRHSGFVSPNLARLARYPLGALIVVVTYALSGQLQSRFIYFQF